ncbi:MAG: hypothetical protein IKD76_06205 [Clostridia bacterium]|nr:hypothetical protein [Clostridia bacterium]
MYYNDYEDYMRNVLNYQNTSENTYQGYDGNCYSANNGNYCNMNYNGMNCNGMNYSGKNCNCMNCNNMNRNNMPYGTMAISSVQAEMDAETIERMYPEIYRIINPMVCRVCDSNTQPITEYWLEQMTNDIYDNVVNRVEIQNVINLNIGTREANSEVSASDEEGNNSRSTTVSSNRNASNTSSKNTDSLGGSKTVSCVKSDDNRETRSPRRRNVLLSDLIRIMLLDRLLRKNRPNRPPYRPCPRARNAMQ